MDNVCHTLVGAACAEAGLKSRTRFATAALLVTANLPDVDVLVLATDTPMVAFRRGWTHGVLAQAALPLLFTGVLLLWDRVQPPRAPEPRARAGALLLLSYIGVLSHVGLDYLNNYGVRLMMPFSNRWFYGDSVFIVDPWLWLALGAGVYVARRLRTARPARLGLVVAACYIALMMGSAALARRAVADEWVARTGAPPQALMVGPAPIDPFMKTVILDAGSEYATGTFSWFSRVTEFDPRRIPKNDGGPIVAEARADPKMQAVLIWSRFPYYQVLPAGGFHRVLLRDLRFGARVGSVEVDVPE